MLVVQNVGDYRPVFPSVIRFMFLDLTCFVVENLAYSHTGHKYMCFQTSSAEIFQFEKCIFTD